MFIKEISMQGFGPFSDVTTLVLDEQVTVLTGANDVGKSAVLRLIGNMCNGAPARKEDANLDTFRESDDDWSAFSIKFCTRLSEVSMNAISRQLRQVMSTAHLHQLSTNTVLHFVYHPFSEESRLQSLPLAIENNRYNLDGLDMMECLPKIVDLTSRPRIRPEIPADDIRESEDNLLRLAFGPGYVEKLNSYSAAAFDSQVRRGNQKLNDLLDTEIQRSLKLRFAVEATRGDGVNYTIGLVDDVSGDTPADLRGTGAQKLLQVLIDLLSVDSKSRHILVLIDEPENSLHADSQHALRHALQGLASNSAVQVIYATHSTAMLIPNRPHSLRLLTRALSLDGNATTNIDNKPYIDSSFHNVRSQLGVLTADSLIFASIAVIVEGPTERLAINDLIAKFAREGSDPIAENLNAFWQLSIVVSAGGTGKFPYWIQFAEAQTVKVIVLLDGDSLRLAQDLSNQYPDISVLSFDERTEIEDIGGKSIYFRALEDTIPGNQSNLQTAYEQWCAHANLSTRMMFTKKVEKWLREELDTGLDKPKVMARAIEIAAWDDIDWTKVKDLIGEVRRLAETL